jgi:hypothetical protein
MANLSLARIMYGTSEDFHAAQPVRPPAFSAFSSQSGFQNSAESNSMSEPATLGGLLHKVWTTLTTKH